MRRGSPLALALAAPLAIACRRAPVVTADPVATADPSTSASATVAKADASVAPEPTLPPLCPAAVATTKKAWAEALAKFVGDASAPSSLVGFCAESRRGAWLIDMPALGTVTTEDEFRYAVEARYTIVFQPRVG